MKVLIAGLGGIGQRHARNLRTLLGDDLDLLAFRTRRLKHTLTDTLDIDPGVDVEEKYGVRVYTDFEEALATRPDACLVCNPSSLHVQTALEAARAGCHLFIEKPLCSNLEGVQELGDLVAQNGLVGFVAYQMRFHPCLRRFQEHLREGRLGPVLAVRAEIGEYLPGWHRYEDYREMYASRRSLGGGVVLSQIHELDYLYSVFGLPRRVFAIGGQLSSLEVDVEDVASILMEHVIDGRTVPVHLHQDYVQRPPSRFCKVIGDAGVMCLDFVTNETTIWEDGELSESYTPADFQRNDLFLNEMKHFLACTRGEESPLVSIEDGANSLRVALCALNSLERREPVEVHPFPNA